MCQARESANPQEDCKKHSTRAAGTHSYQLPKPPTRRGFLKFGFGISGTRLLLSMIQGQQKKKRNTVQTGNLFSCTVLPWNQEKGKGSFLYCGFQLFTEHSSLSGCSSSPKAQSTRSASANAKSYYTAQSKVDVFTCIKQTSPEPTTKLPLYNIICENKFSVKCPKDRICLQLSCSSPQQPQQQEAPRHLQIKTHERNTFNGKRDRLPSTHSFGFGYCLNLGKPNNRILDLQGEEKTRIKKSCFSIAKHEH